MAIHFGELPNIILSPTKTFEKLKTDVTLEDGLKLYVIIAIIALAISLVSDFIVMSQVAKVMEGSPLYKNADLGMYTGPMLIVTDVVTFFVGMLIFLAMCWLVAKLTAAVANKEANFGKTLGLLSYTNAALYVLIMLPIMVISLVVGLTAGINFMPTPGDIGAFMAFFAIAFLLIILFLIWVWLLFGRAAAVAINASWGSGILGVFLTALIFMAVMFVLGLFFWSMGIYSAGSYY